MAATRLPPAAEPLTAVPLPLRHGGTNHAELYGLYPRKGTIAIGSDAGVVL